MKLGTKNFDNPIILAPMAGVNDVGFRTVCSQCGSDAAFGEMISAQAMKYDNQKTKDMAIRGDEEKIVFAQIFGKDPFVMAEAIKNPILQKFDGIDINMGCPAPKIVKNGEGSALLKDLPLAYKIISECVKAAGKKQVSVKVRLGFDKQNIREIVKMCEEAGASFVTVHGRTALQGYAGKADYDQIALAKSCCTIPIIGNGDVRDEDSYHKMLQTGVNGVMIARAAIGQPWIFSTLKNLKQPNKIQLIEKHVEILRKFYPEKWLVLYLRKHFLGYAAGLKLGSEIKKELAVQKSIDQSLKLMKDAFNHFEI